MDKLINYCENCSSTNCDCGCREGKECTCKPKESDCKPPVAGYQHLLNWLMLGLVLALTITATVTFFISILRPYEYECGAFNSIVGHYVLVMLLGAPTLKVFLDKVKCPILKKLNVATLGIVFLTILVQVMATVIVLVL